jgi:hypothetical protein
VPLTDTEVSRLADSVTGLRPDWPGRSVRAFIAAHLRDRTFADVAVALAVVAADPASETPARVLEPGPWWLATRANRPTDATFVPGPGDDPACRRPGHEHERQASCRLCRAEQLAGDVDAPTFGTAPEPRPCSGCTRTSRFLLDGRCITCRTGTPTRTARALEPAKEPA